MAIHKSRKRREKNPSRRKVTFGLISLFLFIIPLVFSLFHYFKPVPAGLSAEGRVHETGEVRFLYDLTYENSDGEVEHDQEIFDYIYQMIDEAEDFIVMDLFLFNDDYDHTDPDLDFPTLSSDLAEVLIQKKQADPAVDIVFITDPINTFYGSYMPDHMEEMSDAGIEVVLTDLEPLRDSNPVYSGFSRAYLSWFGTSDSEYLPNVFRKTGPEVSTQSYINMLHFKANHRKVVMNEQEALITSANPHDASVYHSNIAFVLRGDFLHDLLASERAVVEMSGHDTQLFDTFEIASSADETEDTYSVQLLTENKIKEAIVEQIDVSQPNDAIKIGMFYLSDRDIITALLEAEERGVTVQMILDINQDAFGNEKIGIPNRPVADELTQNDSSIAVRWYQSHGEQYHAKFFLHETPEELTMIGGSTNFTRRNMDDFNLETNVKISGKKDQAEAQVMLEYFDKIWENEDGIYTADYSDYAESSAWKNWLYRFQEWSGMSTF